MPSTNGSLGDFKASRDSFEKFKRRTEIHCVTRHGEGESSNKSEKFVSEFKDYIEAEGLIPHYVFQL